MDPKKTMKQVEREMAMHDLWSMLPFILEYHKAAAKAVRAYYAELLAAGFSEEQALELSKSHGIAPPVTGS